MRRGGGVCSRALPERLFNVSSLAKWKGDAEEIPFALVNELKNDASIENFHWKEKKKNAKIFYVWDRWRRICSAGYSIRSEINRITSLIGVFNGKQSLKSVSLRKLSSFKTSNSWRFWRFLKSTNKLILIERKQKKKTLFYVKKFSIVTNSSFFVSAVGSMCWTINEQPDKHGSNACESGKSKFAESIDSYWVKWLNFVNAWWTINELVDEIDRRDRIEISFKQISKRNDKFDWKPTKTRCFLRNGFCFEKRKWSMYKRDSCRASNNRTNIKTSSKRRFRSIKKTRNLFYRLC